MIDDKFKEIMQSNTGCAVIMAGSGSDEKHIDKLVASLNTYEIPNRVRICSAHKQPGKLAEIIEQYNKIGGLVSYVAVAGGTDALSGTLGYHALGPVISCPPDAPNNSCLKNPPGSANATICRPANVAKFIAQTYAGVNPRFRELLKIKNNAKTIELENSYREFQKKYGEE